MAVKRKDSPVPAKKYCGAKTRNGTPCKAPPMANGRCRLHGGKSGCRPGDNTQHGGAETIWYGLLSDEEKEMYWQINLDSISQIDEELRLISIREQRMLKRYKLISDEYEELKDFIKTDREISRGIMNGREVDMVNEKETLVAMKLQDMENALSSVQDRKHKLLDLKYKIETGKDSQDVDINLYVDALNQSAKQVWREDDEN